METGFEICVGVTTGEPDDAKVSRPVRRGAVGKGPCIGYLAGCLPYFAPLMEAIRLIKEDESLRQGDILCLTDGQFGRPPEEFLQLLEEAREEPGLKVAAVVINGRKGQADFADKVVMVDDVFREREKLAEAISVIL